MTNRDTHTETPKPEREAEELRDLDLAENELDDVRGGATGNSEGDGGRQGIIRGG